MKKQVILGIIVCLILAGGIAGYDAWQKGQKKASFIQEVDRHLSAEDRKIYEDRLVDADNRLSKATDDQERFDLIVYKGFQLQGLGKLAEARDLFLAAAQIKPENYFNYVNLYSVYLETGDYERAKESIQKSLSLKENYTDAWRRYILLEKEKFKHSQDEIKALYREALAKTDSHIDIITDYAAYLESIGDLAGAKDYWSKAIKRYPANKEVYQREIDRLSELIKK